MIHTPKGIDLMPSGKFKATASIGSGKQRKRKSKSFTTITEAKKWMNEMNADMHQGITYFGDNMLMPDMYDQWLSKYIRGKVEAATELSYDNTGKMLRRNANTWTIKSLTRTRFQMLFNELIESGLKKPTVSKFKIHINKFCRDLVREGVVRHNPMDGVDIRGAKSGKNEENKFLTIREYTQLISYLRNKPIQEINVYQMMILVLATTGMRVGEVIDLRVNDVDDINKTLRVDSSYSRVIHDSKSPKTTRSNRKVPVPDFVIKRLHEWRFQQQAILMNEGHKVFEGRLFITKRGGVPDSSMVNYWVKKLERTILEMTEDKLTSTHSLRHTYASYLLSSEGGNQTVQFVASVLGDTQTMVQEVYAHLMEEERIVKSSMIRNTLNAM